MDCAEFRDERLDVLYGEASEKSLRRVAEHHASCAPCRSEFDAMRAVRRRLGEWRLPLAEARAARSHVSLPLGLAAAALVLLAIGGALRLSGVSFEYLAGPVRVTAGRTEDGTANQVRELERRTHEEILQLRATLSAIPSSYTLPADGALLESVKQLLRESDERNATRLKAGLESLEARRDMQRRYDMARISAGLSYLDGKSGQHVARASELMGYVLEASQGK